MPTTVLVGDITYPRTGRGWLYLAVVIDLATRMVVDWSMSERTTVFSQVLLSEKSAPFFRVSSRRFFGFRRGHAASFLTCPA